MTFSSSEWILLNQWNGFIPIYIQGGSSSMRPEFFITGLTIFSGLSFSSSDSKILSAVYLNIPAQSQSSTFSGLTGVLSLNLFVLG